MREQSVVSQTASKQTAAGQKQLVSFLESAHVVLHNVVRGHRASSGGTVCAASGTEHPLYPVIIAASCRSTPVFLKTRR